MKNFFLKGHFNIVILNKLIFTPLWLSGRATFNAI